MINHDPRVAMLIPSYQRPRQAMEAALSAVQNAVLPRTRVHVMTDGHEYGSLEADQYAAALRAVNRVHPDFFNRVTLHYGVSNLGLVGRLNKGMHDLLGRSRLHSGTCIGEGCAQHTHVGFMGDDHRVRTKGWDLELAEAAGHWGMAYGDDGIQDEALPTAMVMSADVLRTLGYMGPPTLWHMYVDNFWLKIAQGLGTMAYRGHVKIEHLHHSVGKSQVDASYNSTNSEQVYERDRLAWERYLGGQYLDDLEKLQRARRESSVEYRTALYKDSHIGLHPHQIAIPAELFPTLEEAVRMHHIRCVCDGVLSCPEMVRALAAARAGETELPPVELVLDLPPGVTPEQAWAGVEWVPGPGGEPVHVHHPSREELIEAARLIHDARGCLCDSKYIMSCPLMAQAILDAGQQR